MNRLKELEQARRARFVLNRPPNIKSPAAEVSPPTEDSSGTSPQKQRKTIQWPTLAMFLLPAVAAVFAIISLLVEQRSTMPLATSHTISAIKVNAKKTKPAPTEPYHEQETSMIATQKREGLITDSSSPVLNVAAFKPNWNSDWMAAAPHKEPAVGQPGLSDTEQIITDQQDKENRRFLTQLRKLPYNYLIDEQGALVLIEGRPVLKGSKIRNLIVEKIAENSIILRCKNKTYKVIWPHR